MEGDAACCPRPQPSLRSLLPLTPSCDLDPPSLSVPPALGHFCRHCLALWWESSRKTECPECREKWEGFPQSQHLVVGWLFTLCLTSTNEACLTQLQGFI
uniref:RING-type domain-containing protein n=1 Tax=Oncorhynchus kisutch TaxID=8019 RepID=A0A8C7I2F0_ONCKI